VERVVLVDDDDDDDTDDGGDDGHSRTDFHTFKRHIKLARMQKEVDIAKQREREARESKEEEGEQCKLFHEANRVGETQKTEK
jgi:hypothetical protein